jgi:hypothetical protein
MPHEGTYTCTDTGSYMRKDRYRFIHAQGQIQVHTCARTDTGSRTRVQIHLHTCTCIATYSYAYTHVYTYTHIHGSADGLRPPSAPSASSSSRPTPFGSSLSCPRRRGTARACTQVHMRMCMYIICDARNYDICVCYVAAA